MWPNTVWCLSSHWNPSKQRSWERQTRPGKKDHLYFSVTTRMSCCVIVADKLCDRARCKWIVESYESPVRTVECGGWGVGGVWCPIHYSWDGWAERKWQRLKETLLLKCINSSRALDLISRGAGHWSINCNNQNHFLEENLWNYRWAADATDMRRRESWFNFAWQRWGSLLFPSYEHDSWFAA